MPIPNVDPIPVPAPIWLIKALLLLTLALHFVAVQLLIGSLLMVVWFSFRGRAAGSIASKSAASVLARRAPAIMTFVINLGIPPLLFAQVLYGRALYTSSILIGAIWFSIIFLLMACYGIMYGVQYRTAKGAPSALLALAALALAAVVGRILNMNMTLMLRPQAWHAIYAASARGIHMPPYDPTAWPRWGFMMLGGLLTGGLWLLLHSGLSTIEDDTRALLRKAGGLLSVVGGLGQLAAGYAVYAAQPAVVQAGLNASSLYKTCGIAWAACAALTVLIAAAQIGLPRVNAVLAGAGWLTAFLSICSAVIYRDGIRDLTLRSHGFDVWARTVVSNWSVLTVFFILFVITLVTLAWLLLVMRQAKPIAEQVTV